MARSIKKGPYVAAKLEEKDDCDQRRQNQESVLSKPGAVVLPLLRIL